MIRAAFTLSMAAAPSPWMMRKSASIFREVDKEHPSEDNANRTTPAIKIRGLPSVRPRAEKGRSVAITAN